MHQYSYRPRMRFYFGGRMTPVVRALLIVNGAVFLLQMLFTVVGPLRDIAAHLPGGRLETTLGLSIEHFLPWQVVTYMFLHDSSGPLPVHLLFNMLALWMLGKEVERSLRSRPFLVLYITSGVIAGLCHLPLAAVTTSTINEVEISNAHIPVIGASGAVFGVLVAYAVFFPDNRIWFIKARYFVPGLIAFETLMLVIGGGTGQVAHLAHIGGAGWGLLFLKGRPLLRRLGEKAASQRRTRAANDEVKVRRRVDELLDKINREGISSLTKEEKDFLTKASRRHKRGTRGSDSFTSHL